MQDCWSLRFKSTSRIPEKKTKIRYEDGNFMIPEGKKTKVINFLKKNNASYRIWKVIPGQDELEKLR